MNPTLAAPQDLGRSNTGYKSDEYVTLVLHSSVVEEIISSLAFNNKVLWQQQCQTKVDPSATSQAQQCMDTIQKVQWSVSH